MSIELRTLVMVAVSTVFTFVVALIGFELTRISAPWMPGRSAHAYPVSWLDRVHAAASVSALTSSFLLLLLASTLLCGRLALGPGRYPVATATLGAFVLGGAAYAAAVGLAPAAQRSRMATRLPEFIGFLLTGGACIVLGKTEGYPGGLGIALAGSFALLSLAAHWWRRRWRREANAGVARTGA